MPPQAANITSTDAVRVLKTALQQFEADVRDALTILELECRRPTDWIENDRSRYWPREVRKATDTLSEARMALERCELTSNAHEHRSCYDEKKALEKAKRRLRLAEEKVQVVQRWKSKIRKEVEEFHVQIAKLQQYLDTDLLRATTVLERMAEALARYTQQLGPTAGNSAGSGTASASGNAPEGSA